MGVPNQYYVVVSILEGRRFPKRHKQQLVIEAKFHGELLATDPTPHTETPQFATDLAWELDKKALHQHRLQHSPIKLQCYCVDVGGSREQIGYVLLDVRVAAQQKPKQLPWYPLLNSKYHNVRPEVRVGIWLEDVEPEAPVEGVTNKHAVDPVPAPSKGPGVELSSLTPVLDEDDGCYLIGPAESCDQPFVLSVTIAFASNLAQLIPSVSALPVLQPSFYFYYSLFDNDVTNETFTDLFNPSFPTERASLRLKTNPRILQAFLLNHPGIELHLCCSDRSLGSTTIPLSDLVSTFAADIEKQPVTVENSYILVPPRSLQTDPPLPLSVSESPCVGVSVTIRRDEILGPGDEARSSGSTPYKIKDLTPQRPAPKAASNHDDVEKKQTQTPPRKQSRGRAGATGGQESRPTLKTPPEKLQADFHQGVNIPHHHHPPPPVTGTGSGGQPTDELGTDQGLSSIAEDSGTKTKVKKSEDGRGQVGDMKVPRSPNVKHISSKKQHDIVDDIDSSSSHQHIAIPPTSHHYTMSIDLHSVSNVNTNTSINCVLRYSYPFFGSAAPVMTNPPVEMSRNMEALLPQSFCAFDFACSYQQINETFLRMPLMIEMWNRDKSAGDQLVGVGRVPLSKLLTAETIRIADTAGRPGGSRQSLSERLSVLSVEGEPGKVADIYVILTLEDHGYVNTEEIIIGPELSNQQQAQPVKRGPQVVAPADTLPDTTAGDNNTRQTQEYQAAIELELWKGQQETVFENQLKQKEVQHMKHLAELWKKRDKEREFLIQKKLSEYSGLEEKLHRSLSDVSRREAQVTVNEQELGKIKSELQHEHDRKLLEIKEAAGRLEEDCKHKIELERAKCHQVEQEKHKLQLQVSDLEKKLKGKDEEFECYREKQSNKPEIKLQTEINLLTLEKAECDRKLDAVTKSKVHYKQQWGRALKELARLKQREQQVAQARLNRQHEELEHMRLRYLAAEEKDLIKSEKLELDEIKNELKRLREESHQSTQRSGGGDPLTPRKGPVVELSESVNEADISLDEIVTNLIEQRDALLSTGIYTNQDRTISELDRQIREAIAKKHTH